MARWTRASTTNLSVSWDNALLGAAASLAGSKSDLPWSGDAGRDLLDTSVPSERLALVDRLILSKGETGPFVTARIAWRQLESDLDQWGEILDSETVELCQDVLGIQVEDIVLVESGRGAVRLKAEGIGIHADEKQVLCNI